MTALAKGMSVEDFVRELKVEAMEACAPVVLLYGYGTTYGLLMIFGLMMGRVI